MTKKVTDPQQLNNAEFRWFVLHFPAVLLKKAKIQRTSFVAVGLALAQHGSYQYGTNVNPSKKLIHNLTGAHEDTIKKVYDVLKDCKAIEVTGTHQGVNGGQPSEIFRFRKSRAVEQVLERRAAQEWKERANPTGESANTAGESANPTPDDNRNFRKELNGSLADATSPAPASLGLTARDGAVEEVGTPELDPLLEGI